MKHHPVALFVNPEHLTTESGRGFVGFESEKVAIADIFKDSIEG